MQEHARRYLTLSAAILISSTSRVNNENVSLLTKLLCLFVLPANGRRKPLIPSELSLFTESRNGRQIPVAVMRQID